MDDLDLQVQGSSIRVTSPRADFDVTYEKHPDLRILIVTKNGVNGSPKSPDAYEVHTRAFHAAVAKARELGWIT